MADFAVRVPGEVRHPEVLRGVRGLAGLSKRGG